MEGYVGGGGFEHWSQQRSLLPPQSREVADLGAIEKLPAQALLTPRKVGTFPINIPPQ